jgi:PAS domain S-box-containing protein
MDDEPTLPNYSKRKLTAQTKRASAALDAGPDTVFELSPVAMAVADLETGQILIANSALAQLVGRDVTELIGKPQSVLYPEGRRSTRRSKASLRYQPNQGSALVEKEVVTSNGTTREVEVRAVVVDYQERKALLRIFCDVTAEKEQGRKLLAMADAVSSETGRTFFATCAAALIHVVEADGVIMAAFDPAERAVHVLAAAPRELKIRGSMLDARRTPWLELAHGQPCYLPEVDPRVSLDRALTTLSTRALIGIPLYDARRHTIGSLVALFRAPIRRPDFALPAVRILAARAGAELERQRDETIPPDLERRGRGGGRSR